MAKAKPFYKKRRWQVWFAGIAQGVIHGLATAGASIGLVGTANSVGVEIPTLTLRQLATILIAGSVSGGIAYLRKSPWPRAADDTNPPFPLSPDRPSGPEDTIPPIPPAK
jgi:hypothetical protein